VTTIEAGARIQVSEAIAAFDGAIVTDRLVLRPAEAADTAALFRNFDDWEIVRWLATPPWPHDLGDVEALIARAEAGRLAGKLLYLAIEHDGGPIGGISWGSDSAGSHLGFWLGRAWWGRGLMGEAAAALCDAIFALSDERAIYSGVFEGNTASHRLQMRLGFIETGRSRVYCRPRGVDVTHIDTKLTRTARRVAARKATS
jgi:RimJ/RimL family protein N-acetyltransferase